jgi:hypothetical protein
MTGTRRKSGRRNGLLSVIRVKILAVHATCGVSLAEKDVRRTEYVKVDT